MGLPWVRLDANIGTHDKILALLAEKDGHRAFTLFVCALGWSGGQGTDGIVPKHALPIVHGTERLAQLLMKHRLWKHPEGNGQVYEIINWEERQQSSIAAAEKKLNQQRAAKRTNCIRYHGEKCGCWKGDTQ